MTEFLDDLDQHVRPAAERLLELLAWTRRLGRAERVGEDEKPP